MPPTSTDDVMQLDDLVPRLPTSNDVIRLRMTVCREQSAWAERERRKSRSALQPISVTPAPRSATSSRSTLRSASPIIVDNLLLFPTVKDFSKSVNSWCSYRKKFDHVFFWDIVYYVSRCISQRTGLQLILVTEIREKERKRERRFILLNTTIQLWKLWATTQSEWLTERHNQAHHGWPPIVTKQ